MAITPITPSMQMALQINEIIESADYRIGAVSSLVLDYLLENSISREFNKLKSILAHMDPKAKELGSKTTSEKIQALIRFQQRLTSAVTYRADYFLLPRTYIDGSDKFATLISNCSQSTALSSGSALSVRPQGADFYLFRKKILIHLQLEKYGPTDSISEAVLPTSYDSDEDVWIIEENSTKIFFASKPDLSNHLLVASGTNTQLLEIPR